MPEVKEYFVYDGAYASTSWTGEWLNIVSSQRLAIIVYCSSSYTTTVEYAIDTNYLVIASDVSSNPVGTHELDIQSKTRFCRLLITGIVQPVVLNIQAFYHDSSLLSKIVSEETAIVVDTGLETTGFGALHTEGYLPIRNYVFTRVANGTALTATQPYSDIKYYDSGVNGLISGANGLVKLSGIPAGVETLSLRGAGYKYNPGQTLMGRYTAKFFQGAKDAGGLGCTLQCAGIGNEQANASFDFLGFGYGDDTLPYSQENFGVIYINRGVKQFIPKTDWNVDKADGTTSTLNVTDWNKLNLFQIDMVYLGGGNIVFKIMDRVSTKFVDVHTLFLAGALTASSLGDPNVGMYMENQVTANSIPLAATDSVESASFGIFLEGQSLVEIDRSGAFGSQTGVTTEQLILAVRNNPTFYGTQNRVTVDIDIITAAVDGSKSSRINFYKNATVTTPTWVDVDATIFPVASDVAGTYTIGTGRLLWTNALAKEDEITMLMPNIHIHLDPGDTLTVTCLSSGATDVSASIGFHSN